MATLVNRSSYFVTVKNNDTLTKVFAFKRLAQAWDYVAELEARGYKPTLGHRHARFGLFQHRHDLLDTEAFAFHRTAPFPSKGGRSIRVQVVRCRFRRIPSL
jgi:hypothetical protein